MAKQNAINNKSSELTIDPGASGDSFVQFDINGTGEFRIGVDDDDADAFVISQGSALGTTNTFRMSAAGERTMPLQPAFSAYNSATDSNVTGDGTAYTLICNTEIFDQNADYDTSTGTFTAPVTGKYWLSCDYELDDIDASHSGGYCQIVTSNRTYHGNIISPTAIDSGGNIAFHFEVLADMDASDTATFVVQASGSAKAVDVLGGGNNVTRACGYLAV